MRVLKMSIEWLLYFNNIQEKNKISISNDFFNDINFSK